MSVKQQTTQFAHEEVTAMATHDYFRQILLAPVYDVAVQTPVNELSKLSGRIGNQVYLKREDLQPVHSFKIRGAYNKLVKLSDSEKQLGVIAASAGNHAQGVALSATKLGMNATIVMPITTPEIKVGAVKRRGGKVVLHGKNFDEAQAKAKQISAETGAMFIAPFDDPDVIIGQGTVAKELMQQQQKVDAVFIPVGGGGLLAGMAVYIKTLQPSVKVIGVEAEDSACLKAALENGAPCDLSHVGTFADGVAVKRIGEETYRLAEQFCDEVITVTSDEICAAIKDVFEDTRAIAEPAGALSLAGLKKYASQYECSEQHFAAVLSGANLNFDTLRYVSERTELGEQKEAVLAVTINEEKGSYRKFCQALGGKAITEFNYRYADDGQAHIFVGISLRDGAQELEAVKQSLTEKGYQYVDLSNDELAKLHLRHMVGGKPHTSIEERIYSFEFPECAGALITFLNTLGEKWNITLFHYRNHGAATGHVLAGFELPEQEQLAFHRYLKELGYEWKDESQNPAYKLFLE